MSQTSLLHQTFIQLQNKKTAHQLQKITKAEETKTVFTFTLNGSEPFTIHQKDLRYIIYKAAMLVHSENTISENLTVKKIQLCSVS